MANYHHGATYGSLAYDLDALAREKQLDEAGKLPQKKVRPAQPEVQPVQPRCGPPLFCCWERCWWWAWSSR